MNGLQLVAIFMVLVAVASAKTAEEWKSRIIYQILTDRFGPTGVAPDQPCTDLRSYCGGTYKGIQSRLDYITGLGANAIWISPIVDNTPGGYHGYWAKNIHELNPEFGTEQDLKDLITECHKRDVWVMVDVVANHMGYPGRCNWTQTCTDDQLQQYGDFSPFNETEHYHPLCHIMDWYNQTEVELCRLANLPDLNSTHPEVRSTQMAWIRDLQQKYDIDGFRVDTVHLVEKPFWREFQTAANAFLLGEVNYGDRAEYEDMGVYLDYMDSIFNFPLYWAFRKVFNGDDGMTLLEDSIVRQRAAFKDMNVIGAFADNHDHPRFLHYSPDVALFKNALAYVMLTEGIPVIYYGTEQEFSGAGDPQNRESLWPYYNTSSDVYKFLKTLSDYRLGATFPKSGAQNEAAVDDNVLAMGRVDGAKKFLAVIRKSSNKRTLALAGKEWEKYNSDNVYVNLFNSSDTLTVHDGKLRMSIQDGGLPVVYMLSDRPTGTATFHGASVVSFTVTFMLVMFTVYM